MGVQSFDLKGMKDLARFEVDQYNKSYNRNLTINRCLDQAIKDNMTMRIEWSEKRISDAEIKKQALDNDKKEIYERYSDYEIQKGKFSKFDAKKLKEISETEGRLNETITSESKHIKDLKDAHVEISAKVKDLMEISEKSSLMFGYPIDPRLKSANINNHEGKATDGSALDFTNAEDRVKNYKNQHNFASNLNVLAGLVGTKSVKEIANLFYSQMFNATKQASQAIDAKKEEINALLGKYGFKGIATDEFRPNRDSNRLEDRPTTEMAVSTISQNSYDILRLATTNNIDNIMEWPEDDKNVLKAKSKEPGYANQVCRAIDNVINSMGGLQGMDVSSDIISKLEKLKAPFAKMVSKQDPEQRLQFEEALDKRDAVTQIEMSSDTDATADTEKESTSLDGPEEEISMEARQYFEMWRNSGTGREFWDWCVEDKHLSSEELRKITGIKTLFAQWDKGVREYNEQQREKAEAEKDVIAPEAYELYDRYSRTGTGLTFEGWCIDRGLDLPKGWKQVEEERLKGQKQYQEQQAPLYENVVIDPMAYGYYDSYSKSGSPLRFPEWCESKGLDIPRGWEAIERERHLELENDDDLEM